MRQDPLLLWLHGTTKVYLYQTKEIGIWLDIAIYRPWPSEYIPSLNQYQPSYRLRLTLEILNLRCGRGTWDVSPTYLTMSGDLLFMCEVPT